MSKTLPLFGAAIGVTLITSAGSGVARESFAAVEVTVCVVVVLVTLGLLGLLVYRLRRGLSSGLTRDAGMVYRAHVTRVGVRHPAGALPEQAIALPVGQQDVRHGEFVVREVPHIETHSHIETH